MSVYRVPDDPHRRCDRCGVQARSILHVYEMTGRKREQTCGACVVAAARRETETMQPYRQAPPIEPTPRRPWHVRAWTRATRRVAVWLAVWWVSHRTPCPCRTCRVYRREQEYARQRQIFDAAARADLTCPETEVSLAPPPPTPR